MKRLPLRKQNNNYAAQIGHPNSPLHAPQTEKLAIVYWQMVLIIRNGSGWEHASDIADDTSPQNAVHYFSFQTPFTYRKLDSGRLMHFC